MNIGSFLYKKSHTRFFPIKPSHYLRNRTKSTLFWICSANIVEFGVECNIHKNRRILKTVDPLKLVSKCRICTSTRMVWFCQYRLPIIVPAREGAFSANFTPDILDRFRELCKQQSKSYSKVLERLAELYL